MGFSLLSAVEEEDKAAAVLVVVKLFCLPPFVYIQGVQQKLCLFLKNFLSSLPPLPPGEQTLGCYCSFRKRQDFENSCSYLKKSDLLRSLRIFFVAVFAEAFVHSTYIYATFKARPRL